MSHRRRAGRGLKKQASTGDYIFAHSELEHPSLQPGGSSEHELELKLLTPLELEVHFEVSGPKSGALTYPETGGVWEETHIFGGFKPALRVASFSNEVKADPNFASSGESKNQRLSLRTEARFGASQWEPDVSLDHPVTIGE
jgi:hypothetical protein